jgi:23S rRNA (uracil1939-C5)-methyltransferase
MVPNAEKSKSRLATMTPSTKAEEKKSQKRKRKTKTSVPKPGEEGYKTPTQLRNERKRRAKQKANGGGEGNAEKKIVLDPSSQYLDNPKAAPIVHTAIDFFKSLEHEFEIHVGATTGWRTVAKLAVRTKDGAVSIGLFAPNSHDLLPVPNCVAHHPSINSAVVVLEQLCNKIGIQAFDDSTGKGHLRHVAINVERPTGKVQLTLVWNSQPHKEADVSEDKKLLDSLTNAIVAAGGGGRKRRRGRKGDEDPNPTKQDSLKGELKLHSLWIHFNASWKHDNAIFSIGAGADSWKHVHGPKVIEETLELHGQPAPVALHFPPNVFRQANIDAFTKILGAIRTKITSKFANKPSCVELYGGVGTIGLNVADLTSPLISSDENPFNKECFLTAATALNDAAKVSYDSKNATAMVQSNALEKGQIIIVDPPRKGLDEEVLTALCSAEKPELLVYVSCGFDAFQRDCNALLQSGWKLDHAEGHILFPGSDAIETLAFFVTE